MYYAWFIFSSRVLVETFEELWRRWGTHECRHSHSCVRTTRQVQLLQVTRRSKAKKKIPTIKIVGKRHKNSQIYIYFVRGYIRNTLCYKNDRNGCIASPAHLGRRLVPRMVLLHTRWKIADISCNVKNMWMYDTNLT